MDSLSRFAAIHAKLQVRKRAFLDKQDYDAILSFANIMQITEFLKKRVGFGEAFEHINSANVHRADLEVMLHKYEVSEIEKIICFFSGDYRAFFKAMLIEYEILDLQLILQTITKEESMTEIKDRFVHSTRYSKLDYDQLLNAKTVTQFVEALSGSIYYNALKTLTHEDAVRREFHMEMKLYVLYYKVLMKQADQLNERDRRIAHELIGSLIDCINIQWIYRATKYYQISPEEILIYVLSEGRKVSYRKLKNLCYTKSLDEFKMLAEKYLGYPIFKEDDDTLLEGTIDRYLYSICMKDGRNDSIIVCLVYIYELLLQVKDLIRITECIRYGYNTEAIKKYLVRVP